MADDKPRGYFKYILAMDCESTGLFFNNDDPSIEGDAYHMAVSWGLIVLDADTLAEVDRLYVEIKWDGKSAWDDGAEKVHGLSKEHLDKNGMSEEDACCAIANLIVKYWGNTPIVTLGHNVVTFDLYFLKNMMRRQGIELIFGNRHIDTNSVGFVSMSTYNSDELFEVMGLEERTLHNALEDIELTVEVCRRIRMITDSALG